MYLKLSMSVSYPRRLPSCALSSRKKKNAKRHQLQVLVAGQGRRPKVLMGPIRLHLPQSHLPKLSYVEAMVDHGDRNPRFPWGSGSPVGKMTNHQQTQDLKACFFRCFPLFQTTSNGFTHRCVQFTQNWH